ncbi:MAG TPA: M23 family metallopeptidase [Gemmatimonadaceae bacterium]|nr:M23 family metallopeptidase [Gemmatimonadaceae bacterium]
MRTRRAPGARKPIIAVVATVAAIWLATGCARSAADAAALAAADSAAHVRPDTLRGGETLELLLRRGGLDGAAVRQIVAAAPMLDPRRLKPGLPVEFWRASDSTPPSAVTFKLDVDHRVTVTRADSAHWAATEAHLPWVWDTVVVRGAVASNLYDALGDEAVALFPGASHEELVLDVADVYKFRVDMTRELRAGDSVYALIERKQGPESTTKVERVLATRLFVAGKPIDAFYFPVQASSNVYYDDAGKSLSTAFLHSPIAFAQVTSSFGMRFHPILRINRPHKGVDYGAVSGTPIHVIGDGVVVRAGSDPGGFGNVVEVRHANGFVTRYAHMSRFSAKAHRGTRVLQGDVIGYVGMTGLATAPHLHFEILVGGSQTNPTTALRNVGGTPLPSSALPGFGVRRGELMGLLAQVPGVVHAVAAHDH